MCTYIHVYVCTYTRVCIYVCTCAALNDDMTRPDVSLIGLLTHSWSETAMVSAPVSAIVQYCCCNNYWVLRPKKVDKVLRVEERGEPRKSVLHALEPVQAHRLSFDFQLRFQLGEPVV